MPFERRLVAIATAPLYDSRTSTIAETLETGARVWTRAASDPGWTGLSARAASEQFGVFGARMRVHADLVRRIPPIFDRANAALVRARDAYRALPPLTTDLSPLTVLARGDGVVIAGYGTVRDGVEMMQALSAIAAQRRSEARVAVDRFATEMGLLGGELELLMSELLPAGVRDDGPPILPVVHAARPSLDDILREYQVSDDPGGSVFWPGWPLSVFVQPRRMTATEASMLDDLLMRRGLLGGKEFQDIQTEAFAEADRLFPLGGRNDNHNDAFRHAYWNAMMAATYGDAWAEKFATAHEGTPGNTLPAREAMDLYNNEVGRRIADENPASDRSGLADLVADAVRNGDLVVVDSRGRLGWSDVVGEQETGVPSAGTQPGKRRWDDIVNGAPS